MTLDVDERGAVSGRDGGPGHQGVGPYRTLLIWPYAVAPAIAGVLWLFMFNPSIGVATYWLKALGYNWNHVLNGTEAMGLVVAASAWKQISYNFLFFLAGLQSIPKSVIEAAAMDGASFSRQVLDHRLSSAIADNLLSAGHQHRLRVLRDVRGDPHDHRRRPAQDTTILVYKVFADGFVGQDLGSSAAQSVILLFLVGILTVIQFRYIERRVHY